MAYVHAKPLNLIHLKTTIGPQAKRIMANLGPPHRPVLLNLSVVEVSPLGPLLTTPSASLDHYQPNFCVWLSHSRTP